MKLEQKAKLKTLKNLMQAMGAGMGGKKPKGVMVVEVSKKPEMEEHSSDEDDDGYMEELPDKLKKALLKKLKKD